MVLTKIKRSHGIGITILKKDTRLSNEVRKLDIESSKWILLIKSSLFTRMLFQIASPTFFSGLPNNDHPEAGQ